MLSAYCRRLRDGLSWECVFCVCPVLGGSLCKSYQVFRGM